MLFGAVALDFEEHFGAAVGGAVVLVLHFHEDGITDHGGTAVFTGCDVEGVLRAADHAAREPLGSGEALQHQFFENGLGLIIVEEVLVELVVIGASFVREDDLLA